MAEKRSFPDNWSKAVPRQTVLEIIKYLLLHYKDYEIKQFGEDNISIDKVNFYKIADENIKAYFMYNFWFFAMRDSQVYNQLEELSRLCKNEIAKRNNHISR
ncbi:MAG: hypothetical protein IJQ55_05675 [Alphaproteobacteria bacterium]|nr:hypothetical protein [Alphaproteobacteria bacterium]